MIPGSLATATPRRPLTQLGESGRTGALHVGGTPDGVLLQHRLGEIAPVDIGGIGHFTAHRLPPGQLFAAGRP